MADRSRRDFDPGFDASSRRTASSFRPAAIAIVALFVVGERAWAIPSPDLVVNLFASAAQVLGLLAAVSGSWFFGRRRRAGASGGDAKAWRIAFAASTALFVAATVGWGLFALAKKDEKARRLQVNLERSSKEDGRTVGDVSLKELSFSDQLKRKDAIHTDELDGLRAQHRFARMYDVRESEEFEIGRIAGILHARYPDVMKEPAKYLAKGEPTLLICFNGNRSSEMCEELRQEGFDVYFIVGGYEKWIAEDRPLEMRGDHARAELRELPDYANKDVLLDTADVMALLEQRHEILFVDVRYPGEYEGLGHLPGAVNVPARKLTSSELAAELEALPRKPVIIPCYDKRSSFYAAIIGLKLSRMGYEFLGRYTTPESFWVPGKDKPHVAAWKKQQEERTLLSVAAAPFQSSLVSVARQAGSLALAIALFVIALRLLVLPLTLKAERDRIVQANLAERIAALDARCKGDGRAVSRGTLKLLREARIRPLVAVLASVAQIVLFMVFFGVVTEAAKTSTERFLWIPKLGELDPKHVLPVVLSLLIAAVILAGGKSITKLRLAGAAAAAVALGFVVWSLAAAVNLYLVINVALVVVQTLVVRSWFASKERESERGVRSATIEGLAAVPLRDADRALGAGNKAARLAQLVRAGLPVPDGFVIPSAVLEARRGAGAWKPEHRAAIERAFAALGAEKVAVRSSGVREDGADKSYAGVFESVLDVTGAKLFDAIESVAESLGSARAQSYASDATNGFEAGGVVVQRMVPAEYAGVLFTEHPGSSGACAVELVAGLGEALVSGHADPIGVRLGRASGRRLDAKEIPIDLAPLFELGRRVEALFGRPQDVEWAFAQGRFLLLQARDVTRLSSQGETVEALRERERARLLALAHGASADEVVFGQNELSELLPRPSPFSLSWMDALWAHGGSVDIACREIGVPYVVDPDSPPLVVGAFGATFVDRREEKRRLPKAPGALAAFRLSRAASELERAWREDHLPRYLREARLREALDLPQLAMKELLELYDETTRRILEDTYLHAERVNIAADFYFKAALRALEKRGLDPAVILSRLPETIVHEAMEKLASAGRGEASLSAFLKLFEHRAPQDFELAQPRYGENPKVARAMAERAVSTRRRQATAKTAPLGKVLDLSIDRACRFQALKEEAKHHALRDFAFLRRVLLEIGERLNLADDVFLLEWTEVAQLADPKFRQERVPELLRERKAIHAAFEGVSLSGEITLAQLEALELDPKARDAARRSDHALKGVRVAGRGDVTGRARVLRTNEEIDSFQPGEVLVARFTDPTWTPVFPRARGIVTEVGGWLSHAAILAREYDITAVVGVAGAMDAVNTGDLVALHADGAVERLEERRREQRVLVEAEIVLKRHTGVISGRFADVSTTGALAVVPGEQLDVGEDVQVRCVWIDRPIEATIVRNGIPGVYGVRFREPAQDFVEALERRRPAAR